MFFGALGNSGKLLPHIFSQDSVVLDVAYGILSEGLLDLYSPAKRALPQDRVITTSVIMVISVVCLW